MNKIKSDIILSFGHVIDTMTVELKLMIWLGKNYFYGHRRFVGVHY